MPFDGTGFAKPDTITTQILIEALRLIKKGWCKGHEVRRIDGDTLAYCSIGAINAVYEMSLDYFPWSQGAHDLLRQAINKLSNLQVAAWNDAPERTKAEVEAAFERAIELSRENDRVI